MMSSTNADNTDEIVYLSNRNDQRICNISKLGIYGNRTDIARRNYTFGQ